MLGRSRCDLREADIVLSARVCAGHLQNGLVNQTEPITLADMGKLFINPGKLDDATFYGHGQSNHLATEGILYPKTSEKDVYRIMGRNGKRYVGPLFKVHG